MPASLPLSEVDQVEILTVLDNSLDVLMAGSETARRVALGGTVVGEGRSTLRAEHGFSVLVTVVKGGQREKFLLDAGLTKESLIHNMDVLEIRPTDLHAIVLSHGHTDHVAGLMGLLSRIGRRRLPLLLHPDAFLQRKTVLPDGGEVLLPPPDRRGIEQEGVALMEERGASMLLGGLALVTGQIARTTDFEKGFPVHYARIDGKWRPDPLIHDDQGVVMNVKDKGLVVLSGCGHAGIVNVLRHAMTQTGIANVHAVLGGFHLTGRLFEPLIAPTVRALKEIGPKLIVPSHCTGWKATHEIARALPDAFVPNSVGTTFVI
ncbi:MAG TPA: MBL fold metallo-hydrolase [Gemmatimonadales bacterium]|nr:MBL fold metallo-hydrolase [Gemmatimonadales bacterium]